MKIQFTHIKAARKKKLARLKTTNQQLSWFLKLPSEIRNEIYELACINGPIAILSWQSSKGYKGASGLLHACHQIRLEVQPIFDRHTTFNLGMLRGDINRIDSATRTSIKSISLDNNLVQDLPSGLLYAANSERARLFRALRELGEKMRNIEHLYVEVDEVDDWEAHRLRYEAGLRMRSGLQHVQLHYRECRRE